MCQPFLAATQIFDEDEYDGDCYMDEAREGVCCRDSEYGEALDEALKEAAGQYALWVKVAREQLCVGSWKAAGHGSGAQQPRVWAGRCRRLPAGGWAGKCCCGCCMWGMWVCMCMHVSLGGIQSTQVREAPTAKVVEGAQPPTAQNWGWRTHCRFLAANGQCLPCSN